MVDVDRRLVLGGALGAAVFGVAGWREYRSRQLTNCSGPYQESGTPVLGPSDAVPVRVFVDYSCPHCKTFMETSTEELAAHANDGKMQLQHYDFPIPVNDRWSYQIANAARFVKDRGGNKPFWEFHEQIVGHQGSYSVDAVVSEVNNALEESVDRGEIESVLSDRPYCREIRESKSAGEEHGVTGTPMVAVGSDWELLEMPTVDEIMSTAGVSGNE